MEWRIGLLILESVSDSAFFASKVGCGRGSFDFLREKYVGLMKND